MIKVNRQKTVLLDLQAHVSDIYKAFSSFAQSESQDDLDVLTNLVDTLDGSVQKVKNSLLTGIKEVAGQEDGVIDVVETDNGVKI